MPHYPFPSPFPFTTQTCNEYECESAVIAHPSEDYDHDKFFSAYTPEDEDGCYVNFDNGAAVGATCLGDVCWWHMSCGRVLGKHNGLLLEYDPSTLAPMGLVVDREEIRGRMITVVDSGLESHEPGSPLYKNREQAIIIYSETDPDDVTVVHPNEDGSYWRKIVRNKVVRMRERRREKAAKNLIKTIFKLPDEKKLTVENTWGPYTSTQGNALK